MNQSNNSTAINEYSKCSKCDILLVNNSTLVGGMTLCPFCVQLLKNMSQQSGWICPKCNCGVSPNTLVCPCSVNQSVVAPSCDQKHCTCKEKKVID